MLRKWGNEVHFIRIVLLLYAALLMFLGLVLLELLPMGPCVGNVFFSDRTDNSCFQAEMSFQTRLFAMLGFEI